MIPDNQDLSHVEIEDLVEVLKIDFPYVVRDVEAIKLGDKLREEMFTLLRKDLHKKGKVIGRTLDGQNDIYEQELSVTTDDIEVLQKKLTLLEASLRLTGVLRDLVEKLPPAEDNGHIEEAGSAVSKFKNRNKKIRHNE